jgi:hypothetical protein
MNFNTKILIIWIKKNNLKPIVPNAINLKNNKKYIDYKITNKRIKTTNKYWDKINYKNIINYLLISIKNKKLSILTI